MTIEMNQVYNTVPGTHYVLTALGAATVTSEVRGESVTLATLDEPGQVAFQAIASTVTITSDTGCQLLPTDAPAGLSSSSTCGGAPTHTKTLASGSTATLRNGQIYVLRQSELTEVVGVQARAIVDTSGSPGGTCTLTVKGTSVDMMADDWLTQLNAISGISASGERGTGTCQIVITSTDYTDFAISCTADEPWPITYTGAVTPRAAGTYADLSALSIGNAVTTAEVWIDCAGEAAPDVALPTSWVWPNESDTAQQPALTAGMKHIFVVRRVAEGDTGVIANLAQIY